MRPKTLLAAGAQRAEDGLEREMQVSAQVARCRWRCLDPDLKVFRYTNKNATGQKDSFSEEELQELPDKGAWTQGELLTTNGEPLKLLEDRAEQSRRRVAHRRKLQGVQRSCTDWRTIASHPR